MISNTRKNTVNRTALDKRDILAAGLAAILSINLIFTFGFVLYLYPKYGGMNDMWGFEYSLAYIVWGVSCIASIAYSIFWSYIIAPIDRWAILALIISAATITIFAFPNFVQYVFP